MVFLPVVSKRKPLFTMVLISFMYSAAKYRPTATVATGSGSLILVFS